MPSISSPSASVIEALGEAWWQRCRTHRCASRRADADERELLLWALGAAAGSRSRLFQHAGPVDEARQASAPSDTNRAGGASRTVPIERRRNLAAAASRWGAHVGSPVLAVEQLVQLRTLVAIGPGQQAMTRLIDLTMVNACRGATDELQRAAFSDPLTGCSNRRAFERDLDRELARCARAELDLSVVAIDLDGLKAVNDAAGHAAGDRQLVLLVDCLRKATRRMDGVYRLGGDEFALLLPDTSTDDAAVVIARASRLGAPSFSWGTASYLSTRCRGRRGAARRGRHRAVREAPGHANAPTRRRSRGAPRSPRATRQP